MKILTETALTYDDVLLVPQYSDVDSRRALSTRTCLTKKIALQVPIVSANMDVVTESEMAITMAREGGIGMIHRFMTIDEQARQIERVKKTESYMVDQPITMTEAHTIGDVKRVVDETGTGGILILDKDDKLIGIISTRDLLFEDDSKPLTAVMSKPVHTAAPDTTLKEAERLLHEYRVEKLPLVDSDGKVAGTRDIEGYHEDHAVPESDQGFEGAPVGRRSSRRTR